jgi:hypothetical protein
VNLLDRFSEKALISGVIKIHTVGAELFHADGRTDTTKLIVAFRNCANAPIKYLIELLPVSEMSTYQTRETHKHNAL